ncbi:Ankyrin repeat-containing protein BDA1 [Camellia lanceoleosa]|uniref:Ankyrin repeat-containing protein BDA1 n=1 Tax=Camellia lanceoleosa TaxID=1840588 RepID=A0ACC0FEX1_9ERIC|nr:Ankyrin repeat-containing protein BDA1 [Camellia lanceoleosa]
MSVTIRFNRTQRIRIQGLKFKSYGQSFNECTDKFNGYGKDWSGRKIGFETYGVNNTFADCDKKRGVLFARYLNESFAGSSMADNAKFANRWVELGNFFRCVEKEIKMGKVLRGHSDFTTAILSRKPGLAAELDLTRCSPLHLASATGHVEIVRALLNANDAVCKARDEDGRTPLYLAVMNGRVEVVKLLIPARPESIREKLGRRGGGGDTVLHLCVKYNRLEVLKTLVDELLNPNDVAFLNSADEDGNTLLHLAAALKQLDSALEDHRLILTEEEAVVVVGKAHTKSIAERSWLCLVGRILTHRPVNAKAFRSTMAAVWKPTKGCVAWGKSLRIRIAIAINKPLRRGMQITLGQKELGWVSFKCERLPNFCFACGILGHNDQESELKLVGQTARKGTHGQYGSWLRVDTVIGRRRRGEYKLEGGASDGAPIRGKDVGDTSSSPSQSFVHETGCTLTLVKRGVRHLGEKNDRFY